MDGGRPFSFCETELGIALRDAFAWDDGVVILPKGNHTMNTAELLSHYSNIVGVAIALPITVATYYQALKARQEVRQAREGAPLSLNCLEFVSGDGACINLVPLDTLHSLPRQGDVVLLPGHGVGETVELLPGAYLVEKVEHIYAHVEGHGLHRLRKNNQMAEVLKGHGFSRAASG